MAPEIFSDMDRLIDFLNGKAKIWSFGKLLSEIYKGSIPIHTKLTDQLTVYTLGSRTDAGFEDIRPQTARKVRNWLSGANQPASREELFKICFALELNSYEAEIILSSGAESGIHYRNPKELVYAFCLKKGMDFLSAQHLILKLGISDLPSGCLAYQQQIRQTSKTDNNMYLTTSIRDEFKQLSTVEELQNFLEQHKEHLGLHHNTAYRKFCLMLRYLADGISSDYPDAPEEKQYSLERVTEEYLRMGIPYQKQNRTYTKLQKQIKKHWPSPKIIQEMYSRKRDVSRKALLLLYLATEGMGADIADRTYIEEHYRRINLMMVSCGMAQLNLHNPFDYLIVQCLYRENDDDFMSWRMERFLSRLFQNETGAAYVHVDV